MMECVWWPVPVGVHQFAALRNDHAPECFLFVFSANPNMLSMHWAEKQRGPDGLYRETSSCRYCGTVLCMHGHVRKGILEDLSSTSHMSQNVIFKDSLTLTINETMSQIVFS